MKKVNIFSVLSFSLILFVFHVSTVLAKGGHEEVPALPKSDKSCSSCDANCSYTGWYAGGQIGIGMTRNVNKFTDIATGVSGSNPQSMRGIIGGLHAGWGYQFHNNFYLGLEVLGNLVDNETTSRSGPGRALKEQRYNSFGLAPRLGYVWNCTMLYLRFGVESTQWKHQEISSLTNTTSTTKKRLVGFVPGVGMSHLISDHFIAGIEGTVGFYKRSRINNFQGDVNVFENNTYTNRSFDITLRLSYKL